MDAILPYLMWAVLILLGLALLSVVLFGLRGLAFGKVNMFTVGSFLVPIVLFVILALIRGDLVEAGIVTTLIMFVLAGLGLLFTGVRGVIS